MAKILCPIFLCLGLALSNPLVDNKTNNVTTISVKNIGTIRCHVVPYAEEVTTGSGLGSSQVTIFRHNTELMLYDDEVARSLIDKWNQLKAKWMEMVEIGKKKLVEIKNQGSKAFQVASEKLKIIKENGLQLIHDAQKTYKEIVQDGKIVFIEFKALYETIKQAFEDLKRVGKEFLVDAQQLLSELKISVAEVELLVQAARAVGSAVG